MEKEFPHCGAIVESVGIPQLTHSFNKIWNTLIFSSAGGNTCFHFYFFEEKVFMSTDRYSVFLSIICYKSFSFQKTQCTYGHPTNKKVKIMNKIFLRCIFDRNMFFSLIKCYCSVFFFWIILCILLLYKCKVHRIN